MEILKGYPNIFFRSDDHLDHEFFIRGIPGQRVPRPMFTTVEEMNETLITRHNERVRKGDLVYDMGDIFVKSTLEQARIHRRRMNGQFFAIKGNHDEPRYPPFDSTQLGRRSWNRPASGHAVGEEKGRGPQGLVGRQGEFGGGFVCMDEPRKISLSTKDTKENCSLW